ncbi:sensor histidine kinase [Streptomyces axinellae]|uniref:Sensor histidine kinase n=1 Tax=Streptomyces axinellae TaxID=552788 RepID=A0ABP6C6Q6_9ACTN
MADTRREDAPASAPRWPAGPEDVPVIGEGPQTTRQKISKAVMITVWLVFLGAPLGDLWSGGRPAPLVACAALGLAAFVATYVGLVFRHTRSPLPSRTVQAVLVVLYLLAALLSFAFGNSWLVLFVYFTVASCAVLPARRAGLAMAAAVVSLALLGTDFGARPWWGGWTSFVIPTLLGGFALMSARQTVRTLRELRAARATVARLAASEERLRLARDLHDLLGHSLSLITLKSELAGRMLPEHPTRAAEQVADIERVSRQALVDVREAVGGYRRPTLAVELAGARMALQTAGIAAEVPQFDPPLPPGPGERRDETTDAPPPRRPLGLAPEQEAALAWALREAVTNVVRHSGATRCVVTLSTREAAGPVTPPDSSSASASSGASASSSASASSGASGPSGPADASGCAGHTVCLSVADNGHGPSGEGEGNGLSGLRERLALADGTLETSAGERRGFTLRATVPSVA